MQLFVQFTLFDSIFGAQNITHIRGLVGEQLAKIQKSGKLASSGIFGDKRGGFLILNVTDGAELLGLLGSAFIDHFKITTHPLLTVEQLKAYFQSEPPR